MCLSQELMVSAWYEFLGHTMTTKLCKFDEPSSFHKTSRLKYDGCINEKKLFLCQAKWDNIHWLSQERRKFSSLPVVHDFVHVTYL
jgi:hypothetical protein